MLLLYWKQKGVIPLKPDLDLFEEALDYDRFCESFDRQPGEASGGWSLLGLLAVAAR